MYRRGFRPGGLVVGRAGIERSGPPTRRRDVIDTAVAPRMAPREPPDGEPTAHHRAVLTQRRHRVAAARRVVPAGRRGVRGDEPLVEPDRYDQQPGGRGRSPTGQRSAHGVRSRELTVGSVRLEPASSRTIPARRAAIRSPPVRSSSNRADDAPAAPGNARTTTSAATGSEVSRCRTSGRSRRVIRCRTTELPTFPDTTKPARDGPGSVGRGSRCTTRVGVPARRPRLITAAKSAAVCSRSSGGSTS